MIRKILKSTILAAVTSLALTLGAGIARAESWRQSETGTSTIRGTWDWDAANKLYHARWENGATATIRVDELANGRAVMTRIDKGNSGFTARYVGTRQGNTFSGTVTWSYQGRSWSGSWRADLQQAAISSGILTAAQAQALFNKMAQQGDIAFEHPWNGCYARAHLMVRRLQAMGVKPGKVWSFSNGEPLRARTNRDTRGFVEWDYHVAPTVPVQGTDGKAYHMVIDPSMFNKPVSVNDWLNGQRKASNSPWPRYCLTKIGESPTLPNGQKAGGTGYWRGADPAGDLDAHAIGEMRKFRANMRRAG
jgi:hypothetical protein